LDFETWPEAPVMSVAEGFIGPWAFQAWIPATPLVSTSRAVTHRAEAGLPAIA